MPTLNKIDRQVHFPSMAQYALNLTNLWKLLWLLNIKWKIFYFFVDLQKVTSYLPWLITDGTCLTHTQTHTHWNTLISAALKHGKFSYAFSMSFFHNSDLYFLKQDWSSLGSIRLAYPRDTSATMAAVNMVPLRN